MSIEKTAERKTEGEPMKPTIEEVLVKKERLMTLAEEQTYDRVFNDSFGRLLQLALAAGWLKIEEGQDANDVLDEISDEVSKLSGKLAKRAVYQRRQDFADIYDTGVSD